MSWPRRLSSRPIFVARRQRHFSFLYAVFTAARQSSSVFLRKGNQTSCVPSFVLGGFMDFVFVAGGVLLWGVTVLMVWGLRKLERPQGGRS
jgi:hypothetical protein